ncbi:cbb3-type cytochrome c oxidase subunit I [Burkholderiaceae bacterium FT117]|uniref:cbb3-type cytochrome c oxidase subunit I n=1 Tax=Zeimonas sediminis TaxID=2944268 RepID=UPI0023431749|nr:cbb3-type cytochrome c oxidase subunit I [Zeimonas sediminis]MCM5569488.1 cbb3-type cytochrome c oxidase subunit I [Zeimonas sediminis]
MKTGSVAAVALGRLASAAGDERFDLPVAAGEQRAIAAGWLGLGVAALVGAGIFSILLVLARTPWFAQWVPAGNFFRVALIVHVDLSVLVWFIAMAGMLWTVDSSSRRVSLGWVALFTSAAGAVLIAAAPFTGPATPIMSNYVPVLDNHVFLYGLGVIGIGFTLLVLRAFLAPAPMSLRMDGADALSFGLKGSAVAAAVSLLALTWSFAEVPRELDAPTYYELLFWGPGHVIQFAWTLLMLVGWAWLAQLAGSPLPLRPRVVALIYLIALLSVFLAPLIYLNWTVLSIEHQRMMTWLMRFGGGLAILPMVLALAVALARGGTPSPLQRPLRSALVCSLALFAVGGVIGFLIRGSDVRVPAHYHGSIVGVTLALMGLAYALLPRFGYRAPQGRLAVWQPWLYAGGQLMHILGLLWSGGYGVQRKVAGAEQVLRTPQEVLGMGLMGLGGLVAIAGGVLFVWVVLRAMVRR